MVELSSTCFGLVYVPELKSAYWVDIQNYLDDNPDDASIHFKIANINRFNKVLFKKIFIPRIIKAIPELSILQAIKYFRSERPDEVYVGLLTMFRRYPNSYKTWDEMINIFRENPHEHIPKIMIYFLAHIPWHPDILYIGKPIERKTIKYVEKLFLKFNKNDIIKLLCFIKEEEGIARGTIGQSVEAIISSLPNCNKYLIEIILDAKISFSIREYAGLILAMNEGTNAIPYLKPLVSSEYINRIINHLNHFGSLNPYL